MVFARTQCRLERPGGVGLVVLLEEQLAPRHVGRHVGGRLGDGRAEIVVGLLHPAEAARGAAGAHELLHAGGHQLARQDQREGALVLALALHLLQQAQLERGIADRVLEHRRLQRLLGIGVTTDGDVGLRAQHGRRPVVAEAAEQRVHLVVLATVERPLGGAARVGLCRLRHRPRRRHGARTREHGTHDQQEAEASRKGRGHRGPDGASIRRPRMRIQTDDGPGWPGRVRRTRAT